MIFAKIVRQTKGANYRTGKEAREAWEAGADFEVATTFDKAMLEQATPTIH